MRSNCHLKYVIVELHIMLLTTLDCCEVAFWYLGHLNVVNVSKLTSQNMDTQHFAFYGTNHWIINTKAVVMRSQFLIITEIIDWDRFFKICLYLSDPDEFLISMPVADIVSNITVLSIFDH